MPYSISFSFYCHSAKEQVVLLLTYAPKITFKFSFKAEEVLFVLPKQFKIHPFMPLCVNTMLIGIYVEEEEIYV